LEFPRTAWNFHELLGIGADWLLGAEGARPNGGIAWNLNIHELLGISTNCLEFSLTAWNFHELLGIGAD
jgi:hypothetical protein